MRRVFALFLSMVSSLAFAQEDIPAPLKLGDGEITFARGEDEEITATYAGKEIYRNYYVSAEKVIKVEGVEVALIAGGDGGNACGPATLIVTVLDGAVDADVVTVGADCGSPTPAVNANEVLFVPYLVPGAKGLVQSWAPSTGLVTVGAISYVPSSGSTWSNFDIKVADTPHAMLANADIFSATQALLGQKFDELVLLLGVAGTPELVDGKYAVGLGCQAHACGSANGFLGVDLEAKAIYAATRYGEESETFWPADFKAWPAALQKSYEASKQP
jgi:hypothetical protein